jgi:putative transposase
LIELYPTFGYRRLWALPRFGEGLRVNRKAVYRILKVKGWFVHQRVATPRPRVQGRRSRAQRSDERWAMDVTHVPCGADGWGHLTAVIDCHDREVNGFEFALRGRTREAERALEEACLARFGTLRPLGPTPVVRSDNGLIFQSRRFRAACRDYHLAQEFITPYTPEQNGLIERFFRSLKEECVCNITSPASPKPAPLLLTGSNSITPSGPTRLSAIAACGRFARYNPNSWLKIEKALHPSTT